MTLRTGVLTISDRSARGERADVSGPAVVEQALSQGWTVVRTAVIPDDSAVIQKTLTSWSDEAEFDLILTTGGTGFSPRDVTPEATLAVVERLAPGLAEGMRAASLASTPHAMLSRAVAGIRGRTLIINLPGSPRGAVENLLVIAPVLGHATDLLRGGPAGEAGHLHAEAQL